MKQRDNSKSISCSTRGSALVWILALIFLCLGSCLFVPAYTIGLLGHYLILDETPETADAIIVLLGGDSPNRILKGHELLTKGLAPRILFGTGYRHKQAFSNIPQDLNWPTPAYPYLEALASLGVAKSQITTIDTSAAYDTAHELARIAKHVESRGWNKVILVSSPTHTRRLTWIWRRVAPQIDSRTVSANEPGIKSWWAHGRLRRAVAYEYGALTKELIAQIKHLADLP